MPPRSCRPVRKIRAFIDRRTALSYLDAMPLDFLISALVTLFVVVDPIGLAPTFLAVTEGLSEKHRRQVALRASIIAAAILVGAAVGGDWLLRQLGISLPAFRIAGGLLLFAIAFEMVFALRQAPQQRRAAAYDVTTDEIVDIRGCRTVPRCSMCSKDPPVTCRCAARPAARLPTASRQHFWRCPISFCLTLPAAASRGTSSTSSARVPICFSIG